VANSQESQTVRFVVWSFPFDTRKISWVFGIEPPAIETWWTDSAMPSKRSCSCRRAPTRAWNTSPTKMPLPIDPPFETPAIGRTLENDPMDRTSATARVPGRTGITLDPTVDAIATVLGVRLSIAYRVSYKLYELVWAVRTIQIL